MPRDVVYVEFSNVTIVRSTPSAGLFRFNDLDGEEIWIPWSQVDEASISKDGETGDLYITEWIAEKKGLA